MMRGTIPDAYGITDITLRLTRGRLARVLSIPINLLLHSKYTTESIDVHSI